MDGDVHSCAHSKRFQVLNAGQVQVLQEQEARVLREKATEPCQSASFSILQLLGAHEGFTSGLVPGLVPG